MLMNAIIKDFSLDSNLNQYPIRARDYGGRKAGEDIYPNSQNQQLLVTTVMVRSQGEIKPFTPIYRFIVEVQIIYNGSADNFNGQLVDTMADAAGDRMQGSNNINGFGREQNFSAASGGTILVYAIMADQPARYESSGFQRIRTVSRTFIATQVAGQITE